MLFSTPLGRSIGSLALLCVTGVIASIAHAGNGPPATAPATRPSAALGPQDVVRAQLSALQHNDAPHPDAGIEVAFGFASPENRTVTGPVEHFAAMVKAGYAPMLNFRSAEYAPPKVQGDTAQQLVRLVDSDGDVIYYVFILGRQTDGELKGCWLTDGVTTLQPPGGGAGPADPPIKT